ncbi:MAG: UDP-N-acetylmuramate dehydrogenase [Candidatus Omnitrophica bacterium]|nr:UDP-N-acetylmuramate dehydrogenase [Candidatus Omnitrophota bacterium]
MNWHKELKTPTKLLQPIKEYTTFKIGGKAKYFFETQNLEELKFILDFKRRKRLKLFVLGGGSNVLITDGVLSGLVIRLSGRAFKSIEVDRDVLRVGAGTALKELINYCIINRLANLEFLAGIPGTVGGAVVMNAGTKDRSISDFVKEVVVMDHQKRIKTLKRNQISFGYRQSSLNKFIILKASFNIKRRSLKKIKNDLKAYLTYRKTTQPLDYPSAGCIFKNPCESISAGELIDKCGLKGKRIGDACVSLQHANFIVNLKKAKFMDVIRLMKFIRSKVKEKFDIELEPEIKIWQ